MYQRVLEDLEDLYLLAAPCCLEDLEYPDLWSPCHPSLLSVHPVHEVPVVQGDLGVLGSLVVLVDHQHLRFQGDL